jgi:uncharacterized protein YnzC (UPF0291/DUF896 family)
MTKKEYENKRQEYLSLLKEAVKLGADKNKVNSYVLDFAKVHKRFADDFGFRYRHIDTCLECIKDYIGMRKEYLKNQEKMRRAYLTKKYPKFIVETILN